MHTRESISMQRCDLHTHSIFSDGTYTPTEIVDGALTAGLSAIALTDHNTVDGLPEFLAAADGKNIHIVPGAEFSVDYNGKELHILGLFIAPEHFDEVTRLMEDANERKEQSNIALVRSLNRVGYRLDYEVLKSATPNGKINRAHIAAAMVEKGYVASVQEAFATVLSKTAGHYTEPKRITAADMIRFIHSIGAVAVLAHPFLHLQETELIGFLKETKGLTGMECYYSTYDEKTIRLSIDIAEAFGLVCSGGSDFHGANKPDIALGVGKGGLTVPFECYEALLAKQRESVRH